MERHFYFNILFLFFILTNLILASNVTYVNYELKRYDTVNRRCELEATFFYNSSDLTHIHLNDDPFKDSIYKQYFTNLNKCKLIIAVKNSSDLLLLTLSNGKIYNEVLIKKFNSKIQHIEPQWYYGRIYVLTKMNQKHSIYEFDLHSRLYTELVMFRADSPVLMTADPLQGTLTYSIKNKLFSLNILYLSNSNQVKSTNEFRKQNYENLLRYNATCDITGSFEFILTSSQIDGFSQIQFFYVRTEWGTKLRCILVEFECNCTPIRNEKASASFEQIYDHYSDKSCSNELVTNNKLSIQIYKSYFNKTSFTKETKKCLRLCPISKFKRDLLDLLETKISGYSDYVRFDYEHDYSCVNQLDLSSHLKDIGLAKISNETAKHFMRLKIIFSREFIRNLSSNCDSYELMYKYIVNYRELNDLSLLNQQFSNYSTESSLETEILLKLESNLSYELNVYLQTPFDFKPLIVGSYLIEKNMTSNFPEPDYKQIPVIPMPYLFIYDYLLNNWSEVVQADSITIKTLVSSLSDAQFYYILTEINTFVSFSKPLNSTRMRGSYRKDDMISSEMINYEYFIFKIDHLKEGTYYNLRILAKKDPNSQIAVLSNMITFRTLDKPSIRLLNTNYKNSSAEFKFKCKIHTNDSSIPMVYITKHLDQINHCGEYSVRLKNSTNHTLITTQTTVFDKHFRIKPQMTIDEMLYVFNMSFPILKEEANYSVELQVNYYSHFNLYSNLVQFKTSKEIEARAILSEEKVKYDPILLLFVFVSLGLFSSFSVLILGIFHFGRKMTKNHKKNPDYHLEDTNLLSKMNPNSIYLWDYPVKDLVNELKGLNKIDEKKIFLSRLIGKGAFGEVFEGKLIEKSQELNVAIKKLKEDAMDTEKLDLIKEAMSLSSFNHPNLIKFYGICLHDNNPKYIVLEYMNMGDLLTYLRNNRKVKTLTYKKAIKISLDVAKGCEFLEQIKMVHRDIAARNCLVMSIENNNECDILVKIGDFGLAREIYAKDYYKQGCNKLLPIRWMSPESIFDGVFTTHSDVWSFGILLWEILTLGCQPYPGMDNKQVMEYIKARGINQIPEKCPPEISSIMLNCWNFDSKDRITFKQILSQLDKIYSNIMFIKYPETIFDINYKNRKLHKNTKTAYDDDASQSTSGTTTTLTCNKSASIIAEVKSPIISDYLIISSDDSESNSSINNDSSHLLLH